MQRAQLDGMSAAERVRAVAALAHEEQLPSGFVLEVETRGLPRFPPRLRVSQGSVEAGVGELSAADLARLASVKAELELWWAEPWAEWPFPRTTT